MALPLRFLFSYGLVIWAFRLKPHPRALEKFGIRVVAVENYGTWNNQFIVYVALELLNKHDREKLELVKKHIRIIFIYPTTKDGTTPFFYMGAGVCTLDSRIFPAKMSRGLRITNVIGWLVYEATRVRLAGKLGIYLPTSKEVENVCQEKKQKTIQKMSHESA